jgi:tetratricopeptide (TPR) repeat protein
MSEQRIANAWKQHRLGSNDDAIQAFREVLNGNPGDLDALYGLGLAQRANGNIDESIETFNKALSISQEGIDVNSGNNNLNTTEDDRFMMLHQMISQRLEELAVS